MKVTLEISVELDAEEYGIENGFATRSLMRDEIREHLRSAVEASTYEIFGIQRVTVLHS
jgi:hypothetical protein